MQLVQTNIGPVEPVTIADFRIVPPTIAGDRSQAMFAQFNVGLQRNAPAFFLRLGDEILPNVARIRTIKASSNQRQSGSIGWRVTNNFGTAIIIGLAVIAAQRQHDIFADIGLNRATNTVMFIAIDLFASGQIVNIAIIASVKTGKARTHIGTEWQIHRRTAAIFGFGEE